jgi:hypothetical protein
LIYFQLGESDNLFDGCRGVGVSASGDHPARRVVVEGDAASSEALYQKSGFL